MSFDHNKIDQKWQIKWAQAECFKAKIDWSKKKFYALDMFPYPSGAGLHVGHLASYMPAEIVSRYKRAKGFNVLHPIGYDAFGLPAEQYAIQTGIHPEKTTKKAIQNFKRQLKSFGFSFDWSREISTCDPKYYKWTQKLFILFFKNNLAYRKNTPVNWCPKLRTTLANEEVINGKSERGGYPVIRKNTLQWMLKITEYAEPLLKGLADIDWPPQTIEGQKNWIGKSQGLCMDFFLQNSKKKISIFTTRPDTLFGCTFLVLSPEHPLIKEMFSKNKEILNYQKTCQQKSEVDQKKNPAKSGVFSGYYAIHPLTQEKLPIWIADYVLMDYGTGAIMAVPAHDERDFVFAQTFHLPIKTVVKPKSHFNDQKSSKKNKDQKRINKEDEIKLPYTGYGVNVNSEFLNGLESQPACQKMIEYAKNHKLGKPQTQYKLRDWIFSRQRYWGEPFPVVHLDSGILQAVDEKQLPVQLPETAHYEPSEKGEPPLARVPHFVNYKNKEVVGKRETDTMPGSAASSWYFLRYTDPHNTKAPFDFEAQKYWMPVDLYVGGPEHTVGHLLYARFWQKVLYDAGLVSHKEPFSKLAHQGSILGSDGQRMSKSKGNTVSPDEIRDRYGADAVRLYIAFLGPFDKDKPWSDQGIEGCRRFLDRFWRFCFDEKGHVILKNQPLPQELNTLLHQTIKKVTDDIEQMSFNTAVSSMMILLNELYLKKSKSTTAAQTLCRLLHPFAPHICEEIWSHLKEDTLLALTLWPDYDPQLIETEKINVAVQVNGKTRGVLQLSWKTEEKEAFEKAQTLEKVSKILKAGQGVKKIIYKPGKILNILTKS